MPLPLRAPERDYAGAVDALQRDMRKHQVQFAPEVTADANKKLASETIERLEKQHAEPQPAALVPAPAPARAVEIKSVEDRKYTIDVAPDRPMYRTATQFEHDVLRHAQPRIALLLSKLESGPLGAPSWQVRTLSAMYFKVKSLEAIKSGRSDIAEHYEQAFQLDLAELLEASNASFGDWRKSAPARITSALKMPV